jgi:hypothetical protein
MTAAFTCAVQGLPFRLQAMHPSSVSRASCADPSRHPEARARVCFVGLVLCRQKGMRECAHALERHGSCLLLGPSCSTLGLAGGGAPRGGERGSR